MDFNSRPNSVDSFGNRVNNSVVNSVVNAGVAPPNAPNGPLNHFYHYNATALSPPHVTALAGGQQSPYDPSMASNQMAFQSNPQLWTQQTDYLSQYYSQYYREYYRRYVRQQHEMRAAAQHAVQQPAPQLRTPLKYGSRRCHARAVFSRHDNRLLVVDNTTQRTTLHVYCLRDLFVDYLFADLSLSPLLREHSGLPFASRDTCLEWLRGRREASDRKSNFELKLVFRVLEMLLKQTRVKGHDFAELLFPHVVDVDALNRQFPRETELLTHSLNTFRALLMRGQRSLALNHALDLNNGLMDHALTLSYLLTRDDNRSDRKTTTNDLMIKTVKKFCETLHPNDPLHVFYTSLVNAVQRKSSVKTSVTFESFLILLSNEIDLNSVQMSDKHNVFPHLLLLVKSLVADDTTTTADDSVVLSDDLFESEMDAILINECLEFARFSGQKFNRKLVEKKVKFVSLLFDFGFVENCLQYCRQFKTFDDRFVTSLPLRRLVYELESRFDPNVVPLVVDDTTTGDDLYADDQSLNVDTSAQQSSFDTTPDDSPQQSDRQPIESTPYVSSEPLPPPLSQPPLPQQPSLPNPAFDFYGQLVSPQPVVQTPTQYNNAFVDNTTTAATTTTTTETPFVPNGEPNGEALSFISTSNAIPSMPFDFEPSRELPNSREAAPFPPQDSARSYQSPPTQRTTAPTTTTTANNELDDKSSQKSSSGLLSKLFSFRPKNQAILPDDSNPTLVYDKALQQWVDTSAAKDANGAVAPPLAAPPVGPTTAAGPPVSRKFEFKSSKRYVDVTRLQ